MKNELLNFWTQPPRNLDLETELVQRLGISTFFAQLLTQRGISSFQEANKFLNPRRDHIHDPFLLPNIIRTIYRLSEAIDKKEKIFVHGDYDVDGVSSTTIYLRALDALGADLCGWKVPHRVRDGYDLRSHSVREAAELGAQVILTTDCGIQARDAVEEAKRLGIEVIITDHHEPSGGLPDTPFIVNPKLEGSKYPYLEIAGVCVAFKVMQALVRLRKDDEEAFFEEFIEIVAIGTISDAMPLRDENRILVKLGLEKLQKTQKPGLLALLKECKADLKNPIAADFIAFSMAPRINAVGRLDTAETALNLFLSEDEEESKLLASNLTLWNEHRKKLQQTMVEKALSQIESSESIKNSPIFHLLLEDCSPGIVGIIAGKLAEAYSRPAIVLGLSEDGVVKGSARSIPGYNVFEAINSCKDLMLSCGGHEAAAGLSYERKHESEVDSRLRQHALQNRPEAPKVRTTTYSGIINPQELTVTHIECIAKLAPFGQGNPELVFVSPGMEIVSLRRIGSEAQHLKLEFLKDGLKIGSVMWNSGELGEVYKVGDLVDLLYTPSINLWRDKKSPQLLIKEIRKAN